MKKLVTKKQEREVLQEDLSSNVKIILEYVVEMSKWGPVIMKDAERLDNVEANVVALVVGHGQLTSSLKELNQNQKEMSGTLKEHGKILEEIRTDLKQKADQKSLNQLDHRVTRLETKAA